MLRKASLLNISQRYRESYASKAKTNRTAQIKWRHPNEDMEVAFDWPFGTQISQRAKIRRCLGGQRDSDKRRVVSFCALGRRLSAAVAPV